MPRKKKVLTPEEQAKRDKFWSRYKTHDGPRGNSDQWKQAAGDTGILPPQAARTIDADLLLLSLADMPTTLAELNKARRRAMQTAHPDAGGTEALAVKVNAAYENLKKKVKK